MELMTPGGYPLLEVASALIKAVRRGHEPESLYWALELESYPHFLFKRLAILACEDVGGWPTPAPSGW